MVPPIVWARAHFDGQTCKLLEYPGRSNNTISTKSNKMTRDIYSVSGIKTAVNGLVWLSTWEIVYIFTKFKKVLAC
jgi:hypothetical protein